MPEKTIDWKCPECNAVLGKLDAGGQTLRIKIRDLYIFFSGGDVTITCRSCGQLVSLSQDPLAPQRMDLTVPGIKEGR
jgi:RNase P subunit RPR2